MLAKDSAKQSGVQVRNMDTTGIQAEMPDFKSSEAIIDPADQKTHEQYHKLLQDRIMKI